MQAPPEHPAHDGAGANGSPVETIGRTRSEAMPGETPESPSEPLQSLAHYSATALFLACARRLRSDFEPTGDDARTIGRICRLLGGMPLGIELAAAWTRTLSLAEIASRLERGMDLLRNSARDVPTRHRSITAAFDYSWRMLSTRQRSVMRQLAVFRGDFANDAAQAVAAASLADLAGLGDASWLRMKASGRLEMHPLVQQYCAAKLEAEHEQETGEPPHRVRDRHAADYASLIMRAGFSSPGPATCSPKLLSICTTRSQPGNGPSTAKTYQRSGCWPAGWAGCLIGSACIGWAPIP